MTEPERCAGAQGGLDPGVDGGERLVGGEEHDEVGAVGGFGWGGGGEAVRSNPDSAGRTFAQADDHVEAAIA